jgi:UPF0271 protein
MIIFTLVLMDSNKKTKIYIIDTSAVLSGKPLNFNDSRIVTTEGVYNEFKPGGKDYQNFQFLLEKGLIINSPSDKSINKIKDISTKTGDTIRVSKTDIELLALALDYKKEEDKIPIILTDDYSIQNIANFLNIKFKTISQQGIKKRFKWSYQCRGCGKKFKEKIKKCPICGSETRTIVVEKTNIKKCDNK